MRNLHKLALAASALVVGLGVVASTPASAAMIWPHGGMGGGMHGGMHGGGGGFGHRGGGGFGPGVLGGFAAGTILGAATAPYYDYGYDYGNADDSGCYQYRKVWSPRGQYLGVRLVDICQ